MIVVVVGALVRERRVLLAYRKESKRAYPAVWGLPGGVVESDESELDALSRELHEELGAHIATGSASHLCRLTVGTAEEPALLSAWLVPEWVGSPVQRAVIGTTRRIEERHIVASGRLAECWLTG